MLAAETLGRPDAESAAVIGVGVNGRAAARTFAARGRIRRLLLWDIDPARAAAVADELGKTEPRTARVVRELAERFAYEELLALLEGGVSGEPGR